MTKDEIKAYAQELIELAGAKGETDFHAELRTRIVQQVVVVCGMPFDGPKERAHAIDHGAGAVRTRGTH